MSRQVRTTPPVHRRTVTSPDGTTIGYQTLGSGPDVIVIGGALRTAEDYLPFASTLAGSSTVHVVDRRGRGASGPQGPGYTLGTEVEDLLAVQADTGARLAFGHSYGGLVALETARSSRVFERIVVYEPGTPADSIATGWMGPYRERLAAGDDYGAFAHFIQGSGGAPRIVSRLPHWYLRAALRVGFRGQSWRRMQPLLEANLAEHQQVTAQQGRLAAFSAVTAPVLLLVGGRTVRSSGTGSFDALRDTLPDAGLEVLPGLDHFGPEGAHAEVVARRAETFLLS